MPTDELVALMYFDSFPTEFVMDLFGECYTISIVTNGSEYGGWTGSI